MTRPTFPTVDHGNEDWDADVQALIDMVSSAPVPIYQATTSQTLAAFAAAHAAASYDRCFAWHNNSTIGYVLVWSDGTNWRMIGKRHVFALTDAATVAVDAAVLGDRGKGFFTIGGNRTLGNPTGGFAGQVIEIQVKQDGTGSRTLAYDTKYRFSTTIPSPTLSTTAAKKDKLMFEYDEVDDKWDCLAAVLGF